jgi:hypothetical protein
MVSALLSAAADREGRETPLTREETGVWAFGKALPQGLLDQQEVGLLMRALSFAQGQEVPERLMTELAAEAARFVAG